MQDSRPGSTLELVVNEQQMHNMSQVDLRPSPVDMNQQTTARLNNYIAHSAQQQREAHDREDKLFSFEELRGWPARFRESLQTKLDEAKARSETRTEYVVQVIRAFSGIFIWVLCFVFTILLPIVLFFIGLLNLDKCNDRPSLPYLVLAMGFFMTASNLFNLAMALDLPILTNHKALSDDVKNIIASILNILFNCVVAFLYILTAYMVFSITRGKSKQQSDRDESLIEVDSETRADNQAGCNGAIYNFTFWFITLTLGSFGILSLIAAILFAYNRYRLAIIRGSTPRSHQTTNSTSPNNGNINQMSDA